MNAKRILFVCNALFRYTLVRWTIKQLTCKFSIDILRVKHASTLCFKNNRSFNFVFYSMRRFSSVLLNCQEKDKGPHRLHC